MACGLHTAASRMEGAVGWGVWESYVRDVAQDATRLVNNQIINITSNITIHRVS